MLILLQQQQLIMHFNNQYQIIKIPSKVLIAGGYGVLQENNFGLSLGLQNYFYCLFKINNHDVIKNSSIIKVKSPQISGVWEYRYDFESQLLQSKCNNQQNPFIEQALKHSFFYFKKNNKIKESQFEIILLFDSGFISEVSKIQQQYSLKFINYDKSKIKKTGMGSSACVIVSVITSICYINKEYNKNIINILSQISNLSAQNKIGSNFDISTAVFGSQLYQNVLPRLAYQYIKKSNSEIFTKQYEISTINKNNCYKLYLLDLSSGSNTRKMVSSFLNELKKLNIAVQERFYEMSRYITLNVFNAYNSNNIEQLKKLNKIHRQLQQEYSQLTCVEIEPLDLKILIDKIYQLQKIAYVICPGSGGFDAICLLSTREIQSSQIEAIFNLKYEWKLNLFQIDELGIQPINNKDQQSIYKYLQNHALI